MPNTPDADDDDLLPELPAAVRITGDVITDVPPPISTLRAEGQGRWKQICLLMINRGTLTTTYLPVVEHLCRSYDTLMSIDADISQRGHMIPGPRGRIMANPLLAHRTQTMILIRSLLNDLGLTPAAIRATTGRQTSGTAQAPQTPRRDRGADPFKD